jgi:hypothetical protein
MSSDIVKEAVFDDRIIQNRPRFAVEKGALSVTNAPFQAISQTPTQHTYNIYVPSENVFVDRALELTTTCSLQATVTYAVAPAVGVPVAVLGKDLALTAFPFNSLCSTLTTTINDTTATINSQDVLKEILRLTDYKHNRLQRTCPTALDNYLAYADGNGAINTPQGSYSSATAHDVVPNGAFPYIVYTNPTGAPLSGAGVYVDPAGGNVTFAGSVPVGDGVKTAFTLFFQFRTTEKLVLSPFVFADCHEHDTGLFGINNIQIVCNLQQPSRVLRSDPTSGAVLSAVQYNAQSANGGFQNSIINVQFLTPSLDVDLPPKSVVPYMEFPRYISPSNGPLLSQAVVQIQSQTITLPQIPDLLLIYVKALQVAGQPNPADPSFADGYLSVATGADGQRNPLSVNFDNFSGLLSSHTAEQLYAMSIKNGLEMDWQQWSGRAQVAGSNIGPAGARGGNVGLTGGMLVLKPGVDITLQSGQAPSLVGNFTLQLNLSVRNNYSYTVNPQMFIVAVNSGFFESIRGSSRIIKGILSEQDIIDAPIASAATRSGMARMVGAGFMSNLSTALSKAKDVYQRAKPVLSAAKGALPEGSMARRALEMTGHGTGAGTGAGRGKKGLAARLM